MIVGKLGREYLHYPIFFVELRLKPLPDRRVDTQFIQEGRYLKGKFSRAQKVFQTVRFLLPTKIVRRTCAYLFEILFDDFGQPLAILFGKLYLSFEPREKFGVRRGEFLDDLFYPLTESKMIVVN